MEYNLTFPSGMVVMVNRVGPKEQRELSDRTSRKRFINGREDQEFDIELWLREAPEFYIADIKGCTLDALADLNVLPEEIGNNGFKPVFDADGAIPYSKGLAKALWRAADAQKFSSAIVACSREMLAMLARAKKNALTTSGDSSAT